MFPAQQLVDGYAQRLTQDVPTGDFDGRLGQAMNMPRILYRTQHGFGNRPGIVCTYLVVNLIGGIRPVDPGVRLADSPGISGRVIVLRPGGQAAVEYGRQGFDQTIGTEFGKSVMQVPG